MGPLQGIKVVEIAGIGPGPFCGMLLSDMGADVVRIDRPGGAGTGVEIPDQFNVLNRGRRSVTVDLKTHEGVELILKLCRNADALIEGFRPGVMEQLGLGPADCQAVNTKLVYGRVTGWGQEGPLARTAGHDGNYASIVGAIHAIGDKDGPPAVPLNLVGDYGGGGAYLAIGILAALLEAQRSGKGQVVDAAMVDGAASLMSIFYGLYAGGLWRDERASNLLDGAAPFYRPYETRDGKYVFVGAVEPQFFTQLLAILEIDVIRIEDQHNRTMWSSHAEIIGMAIKDKTREEWAGVFAETDACVSPVLSLEEAPEHPHNRARGVFVNIDGVIQPAPAPRFSRSVCATPAPERSTAIEELLARWASGEAT